MEELAELDEGGEAAALMSAEGFKAYADDSIWVSMIPTRVKWGGGFLACVTGGGGGGGGSNTYERRGLSGIR
jgi:hypothetical protein